ASIIRSLPEITRTVRSQAALTDESDADGVVRAVPLLTLAQDQLMPTFALEVLRTGFNIPSIAVTTGIAGIKSVEIGGISIPTDSHGRAYLHFGPPQPRFRSADAVLDPAFDPEQFAGQIVLLGVTGLGLLDQKLTPWGLTQGIDVHAQLI